MKYGVFVVMLLLVASIGCTSKEGKTYAVIDTSMGTIKVELYTDKMPITTDNFIKLAKNGFYNGLIFHRVKDDFIIQAGLMYPNGTQKHSPYGSIEFENNPEVKHVDGAISMASTAPKAGGSSQFFICDGEQPLLDGYYAAFGVVVDGIDVVRAIASTPHDGSLEPSPGGGKPLNDVIINSITIEKE